MTYTPTVPQSNQQIASTQAAILNNFAFIQTDLQVDHVFNGNNSPQPEGTHLQAQMKNRADPVSLPANINGIYYVGGGLPKFYNASGAQFLALGSVGQLMLTGTVALNSSSATTVVTLPASSVGNYYIRPPSGTSNRPVAGGQFVCTTTVAQDSDNFNPQMDITISGLALQAKLNHSADNGTYTYLIVYYIP